MSDLVNRLRGQYTVGPDNIYGTRSFADFIPPISFEAADRIEQLEQAMANFVSRCEKGEIRSTKTLKQFKDLLA